MQEKDALKSKKPKNSQVARLKSRTLQSAIALALGSILLILLFGATATTANTYDEQLKAITYTNQYRLGSKTLTYMVQAYAVTAGQKYYDGYMRELNEDKNRDIAWAELEKLDITASEWAYLEQIAALSNNLVPLETSALEAAAKGDTETARAYVFSQEYGDTIDEINALSDKAIAEIQSRKSIKSNRINTQVLVFEILLFIAFGILTFQVVLTIRFARKELLAPITKVEHQMRALADGNLHVPLDLVQDDSEVGDMVSAIALMKQNLLSMIDEIRSVLAQMANGNFQISVKQEYPGDFEQIKTSLVEISSDMKKALLTIRDVSGEIDKGSEQLAEAAENLAGGCTTQASRVSELTALIQTMSDNMQRNAQEASDSVNISLTASEALAAGNEKMTALKVAISEINKCSEQIRSIISTIQSIASQTNLLSLNAAIEAARAGEAGKGFAVVADQVKNLAKESAQAAGETTELIETTVIAVEKGISIADETAKDIAGVMVGAQESTARMTDMAALLKQDVDGMAHISDSIQRVSEIVDSNSTASEETAAVSEQQKAQVEAMVQMMSNFQF